MDDYGNKELLNPDNLYSFVKSKITDSNNYYILLDKIQMASEFETTYFPDIINQHNLRGNSEINELTNVIASSMGALTNPLKLSHAFESEKKVKCFINTIASYLDYLQDAFLIDKALRYDISTEAMNAVFCSDIN